MLLPHFHLIQKWGLVNLPKRYANCIITLHNASSYILLIQRTRNDFGGRIRKLPMGGFFFFTETLAHLTYGFVLNLTIKLVYIGMVKKINPWLN